MQLSKLFQEIIANYQRHDWQLRRVLLCAESKAALGAEIQDLFAEVPISESTFDALWFARPSSGGREAWELRLAAEHPYALFEAFGADASEADREAIRCDMELRMSDFTDSASATEKSSGKGH